MKIVLLHGGDTEKSYARYSTIIDGVRKKGWKVSELSYKDDIKNKLVNTSLFEEDILYTIKNADKIESKNLDWLTVNHKKFSSQLLLISNKKIPATFKKKLPKETKLEEFEKPVLLWKFLDSIVPGNTKNTLKLFNEIKDSEASELIVSLMAGLFRDMYAVHIGAKLPYPDWRAKKISSQSKRFTKDELKNLIKQLADIDIKSKTSDTDATLLIELLIVKNLG